MEISADTHDRLGQSACKTSCDGPDENQEHTGIIWILYNNKF